MRFKYLSILLLTTFMLCFSLSVKAASREIVETNMLSMFLGENFKLIKQLLKITHNMQYEAKPFLKEHHRAKFRFEPNDKNPRRIMSISRQIAARFKIVNGLLSRSDVENKQLLFEEIFDSTNSINTYGKRAIRAIRDNNYALYLAAANGIEKEIFHLNSLLDSLEDAINTTISENDSLKENL